MRTIWIVRWRGVEESFPNQQDAMDRQDQLDALGIEAELLGGGAGRTASAAWMTGLWHPILRPAPTAEAA
jgi:hypothetical protein